jgi:hypothetical protein
MLQGVASQAMISTITRSGLLARDAAMKNSTHRNNAALSYIIGVLPCVGDLQRPDLANKRKESKIKQPLW